MIRDESGAELGENLETKIEICGKFVEQTENENLETETEICGTKMEA
jgi:hypothetical protein